jgi:hypothetical protein
MADESPDKPARLRRLAAALKRADRQATSVAAARALRKRLPGDDRYGDPLSVGGHAPPELLGARLALLAGETPSALKELGFGALQVWQSLSEAQGRGQGDRELAILFTDLAGVDVNIAARIADAAGPGEVLISRALLDRLDGAPVAVYHRRTLSAKGAPAETEVLQVDSLGR